MILYLDASAMVKLYFGEDHSNWTREHVNNQLLRGGAIAGSAIAYVETRAAFARAHKRKPTGQAISKEVYERALKRFDSDAGGAQWIFRPLSLAVLRQAAAIADTHALRGYDATHLATALELRTDLRMLAGQPTLEGEEYEELDETLMLTFDWELFEAARAEGIAYEHPEWKSGKAP